MSVAKRDGNGDEGRHRRVQKGVGTLSGKEGKH